MNECDVPLSTQYLQQKIPPIIQAKSHNTCSQQWCDGVPITGVAGVLWVSHQRAWLFGVAPVLVPQKGGFESWWGGSLSLRYNIIFQFTTGAEWVVDRIKAEVT